ncbi:hypothetical protein [Mesorhizobium sp.]|jgi:hypothetical protein|uniref:hypothetical protein n=1 Tax=Mesorhizobium sp. TaxID=1871066 RepID=UPI003561F0EB
MKVLIARILRSVETKAALEEKQKALAAEIVDAERRRLFGINAFATFGFDVGDPELWTRVREAMGEQAYEESIRWGTARYQIAETGASGQGSDKDGRQSQAGKASLVAPTPVEESMPTIREMVIAQLALAGDAGTKAADIRKFIEQTYKKTVHEKTVGMTLYRLSLDGLARRDGRTWFSDKPETETENPGVSAPGSEEGVSANKGGA